MQPSYTVTMHYLERISYVEHAIEVNNNAIEHWRNQLGLKGFRITEKTTGTKSTDGLEVEVIEIMERIEHIKANNELFKDELAREIKYLEQLSANDQALIRESWLTVRDPDKIERKPMSKHGPTDEEMERLIAPFRVLDRLYEVLPERWKDCLPKAI